MEYIRRNFTFLQIRRKVSEYIKRYNSYNKNKVSRYTKYGNLQFRELLRQLQDEVTIDFIVKLPKLQDPIIEYEYDSILIIVNRLIKYSYFISYSETIIVPQLGYLILDRLIYYYGIPRIFITDRDKLFILNYQKTLIVVIGIKYKLLTAFYPEIDGQIERAN